LTDFKVKHQTLSGGNFPRHSF